MDFDTYEDLPTSSTATHMSAGAIAGIMEHCIMFPIDSVKTRMQSLAVNTEARYYTVRHGLIKMVTTEGILRPLKGMNVVVVGAGPAHALYYSAYENIKQHLGTKQLYQSFYVNAAAGIGATLLHDAVMVPVDVVKQRMQMFNSPFRSCFQCIKHVTKTEGVSAFYRSYTTQLTMNIPFHAIHVSVYEKLQQILNSKREYNPKIHLIAGGLAGGIAAGITTPLDMAKTVLNVQESSLVKQNHHNHIKGLIPALRTIYLMQGFPGFFRGVQARVLYQMPGTAISWSIYELFKYHLSTSSPDGDINPDSGQDLISDQVTLSPIEETKLSHYQDDHLGLGSPSNKTVGRLKHLPMPGSLTAGCIPIDDTSLQEKVIIGKSNRI